MTFLEGALDQDEKARDDAREYHKLVSGKPKHLLFIIDNEETDTKVERKIGEDDNKPYSELTFLRVIDLDSEVQEPKPLRTTSKMLKLALKQAFDSGNFKLEIVKTGEGKTTQYSVRAI